MITGSQLKALRISAGLTQSQLAEKLGNGGYTKFVVSAVEHGKRNIGLNLLADWANACGYHIAINFTRQGEFIENKVGDIELPPDFEDEL